jgi:hypothetical protein
VRAPACCEPSTKEWAMKRRKTVQIAGLVLLTLMVSAWSGCATIEKIFSGKTLAVSGESLDATSILFSTWSKESAERCNPAKPTASATYCNRSADFQGYFRPAFLQASGLWRVAATARIKALESGDAKTAANAAELKKSAEQAVNVLTSELRARLAEGK